MSQRIQWYSSLNSPEEKKKSLQDVLTRPILLKKFVVCKNDWWAKEKKVIHVFSAWESFIHFYKWYAELSHDPRKSYYEVIQGENPQKPRFDIDIEYNEDHPDGLGEAVKDILIKQLRLTAQSLGVNLSLSKDICLYKSDHPKKFSMHVVVNHWAHANFLEAKAFATLVISKLPDSVLGVPWETQWIDPKVYSKNQQFRFLFSTKYGTMRHKYLLTEYVYNKKLVKHVYDTVAEDEQDLELLQFEESLVTFVQNCSHFPSVYVEPPKKTISVAPGQEVIDEDVHQVMKLLPSGAFELRDIQGMTIYLKRLAPTYCHTCGRAHEHENPLVRIDRCHEDNSCLAYFYCLRHRENKAYLLGRFEMPESVPEPDMSDKVPEVDEDTITRALSNASSRTSSRSSSRKNSPEKQSLDSPEDEKADRHQKLFQPTTTSFAAPLPSRFEMMEKVRKGLC